MVIFKCVYVVVKDVGTENEKVDTEHDTYSKALKAMHDHGAHPDTVDVMKRLPDGTLTTEF